MNKTDSYTRMLETVMGKAHTKAHRDALVARAMQIIINNKEN